MRYHDNEATAPATTIPHPREIRIYRSLLPVYARSPASGKVYEGYLRDDVFLEQYDPPVVHYTDSDGVERVSTWSLEHIAPRSPIPGESAVDQSQADLIDKFMREEYR